MRKIAAALLLSGLLSGLPLLGAAAQQADQQQNQQPGSGQAGAAPVESGSKESTGDALARDGKVQESQDPHPTAQGTKSPNPTSSAATGSQELQQALADVRRAPPDLNGNPVPRPNQWASEPDQQNEPTRSQNPSDLTSQEVK
ncbi:hypothetical protein HUE56_04600 (plasmid) [Azospirillum oryzae]|uniref:Serine/threonine protein kinase n=1 Tax=Azospirillum oryzae TaxID=286727 RepID=A0A6N1AFE2_9PROT|nr:hypothetical protein [Azospirillum oryzae]KAA0584499.1 hypothetical protein FZ938_29450 [Azospirillum oryzae]QKS49818.1 hypothetical protein HUE56_04600 [Azospirillum oryzae]GLR79082.1 hypothetical protein GCM10007856_17560 [Azospirillum oryzae]